MAVDKLKDVWMFLASVPGIVSLVPVLGTASDVFFRWLPVSSAGRGVFYFVFWLGICLTFLAEVPPGIRGSENETRKKALYSLLLGAFILAIYFLGGMYLQDNPPDARWVRQALPYVLAMVVGVSIVLMLRSVLLLCVEWFRQS